MVSSYQTSTEEGFSLTIEGANFGAGPHIVVFDDFDNRLPGSTLTDGPPTIGHWYTGSTPITNSGGVDGNQSALVLDSDNTGRTPMVAGIADPSQPRGLKLFQEVFFQVDIKDLGYFPGRDGTADTFSTESSAKDVWMMLGPRGDNTSYSKTDGHDLIIPTWTGGGFSVGGNETRMSPSYWQKGLNGDWAFQDWNQITFHARLDPANPYGDVIAGIFGYTNNSGTVFNPRAGNFMSDQTADGIQEAAWDRLKIGGWYRAGGDNRKRIMDNVYVAVGDNAAARVEIANSKDYFAATRRYILPHQVWSSGRIVTRAIALKGVDLPGFYVFVTDGEGRRTTQGVPVCPQCPSAPRLQIH